MIKAIATPAVSLEVWQIPELVLLRSVVENPARLRITLASGTLDLTGDPFG